MISSQMSVEKATIPQKPKVKLALSDYKQVDSKSRTNYGDSATFSPSSFPDYIWEGLLPKSWQPDLKIF